MQGLIWRLGLGLAALAGLTTVFFLFLGGDPRGEGACRGLPSDAAPFQAFEGQICGPDGELFLARGINLHADGFPFPGNTAKLASQVEAWGFNAVRANPQALFPHKDDTFEDQASVGDLVDTYTKRKMVVMVEAHDRIGGWFEGEDLDRLVAWFEGLAEQYKDNPYVWLGIQNEPGAIDSKDHLDKWLETHQRAIDGIRAKGFRNPIVVNDWYWGQGSGDQDPDFEASDSAILTHGMKLKDPADNLVFDLHVYDQWDTNAYVQLRGFAEAMADQEMAWVVGEFGHTIDGTFREATDGVFLLAAHRPLGYFLWNFYSADAWDLTTTANGGGHHIQFDRTGTPTNLSPLGQKLWDSLQATPERTPLFPTD